VWNELADKVLEDSKAILGGEDENTRLSRQRILLVCLTTALKLLHPFMPFITEVIWQRLPKNVPATLKDTELLMVASWPK
jgi:valyl-tRNA synthetase